MGLTDQIDLKPLTKAYLFANTPMYLYRHLRGNASLRELVEHNPIQVLTSEYEHRTAKETRSIEDVVVAYAVLVGITFLGYQQALEVFHSLELSRLDWGHEIKDIFISTARIVSFTSATVKPQARIERTESSSSQNVLEISLRTKGHSNKEVAL